MNEREGYLVSLLGSVIIGMALKSHVFVSLKLLACCYDSSFSGLKRVWALARACMQVCIGSNWSVATMSDEPTTVFLLLLLPSSSGGCYCYSKLYIHILFQISFPKLFSM